ERDIQRHAACGQGARLHGTAERRVGGGDDHTGRAGDGPRQPRQHSNELRRHRDRGDRHQSWWRRAVGYQDPDGGERGGDLPRLEHRQGGHGLHAGGHGSGERDQHGVQHHGGDGDPARVLRAAEHHGGGGRDRTGGGEGSGGGAGGRRGGGQGGRHARGAQ